MFLFLFVAAGTADVLFYFSAPPILSAYNGGLNCGLFYGVKKNLTRTTETRRIALIRMWTGEVCTFIEKATRVKRHGLYKLESIKDGVKTVLIGKMKKTTKTKPRKKERCSYLMTRNDLSSFEPAVTHASNDYKYI